MKKLENLVKDKVILITGGTGSFGTSVVQKLITLAPKKIIIFSRDEKKQFDMRNKYDSPLLKFVIGDVRDLTSVQSIMNNVDYVFHAAALKQVPTCEFFPMEAIKTNVLGAQNVLSAAVDAGIKRVVILSTDKAVYPINTMGTTKALMEKIMIATAKNIREAGIKQTILCGVRYGNVLYSRGSVVPYFTELIWKNKKLSVTNYDMTRFLLPLKDAVDLVLFALSQGEHGYMYVKKAPATTLHTLAEAICQIYKYDKSHYEVGIRAGEKMHEALLAQEELLRAIDAGKYYKIPPESQGLDYNQYFFRGNKVDIEKMQSYTSENTIRLDTDQTIKLLLKLPEVQQDIREYKKTRKALERKAKRLRQKK